MKRELGTVIVAKKADGTIMPCHGEFAREIKFSVSDTMRGTMPPIGARVSYQRESGGVVDIAVEKLLR